MTSENPAYLVPLWESVNLNEGNIDSDVVESFDHQSCIDYQCSDILRSFVIPSKRVLSKMDLACLF